MSAVPAWGKTDRDSGAAHHLVHHSADVAFVFAELLRQPPFRRRAETALGRKLFGPEIECLAALAFLHDIGKLAPAFQAKGWPDGHGIVPCGHLECGYLWLRKANPVTALDGGVALMRAWPGIARWFPVLFAHHGRPVPQPPDGYRLDAFRPAAGYNWRAEETQMGRAMRQWFPAVNDHAPPPPEPRFAHFFCGLLAIADWVGSDRRAFPFVPEFDPDYGARAKKMATKRVHEIGLSREGLALAGAAGWDLISPDHPRPRPAQASVGGLGSHEQLVILEAETGSGKTEAALWRFATLFEAGEVDALYFAVPTRAAARQLHARVRDAVLRMFVPAPEPILAIPGQRVAGDAVGTLLPGFDVRWDDDAAPPARWAAEHATRFLAAQVAVGTVDQVMLAGLCVKHAHMRGSALARALLVIDEVHASDAYMTRIQYNIARAHLDLGGHVMLMSATLGAAARGLWRGEPPGSLGQAVSQPYPAVWTADNCVPVFGAGGAKHVAVQAQPGWSGEAAATLAMAAGRSGARVLVVRNTVDRARETWRAVRMQAPELLLSVQGVPTLHHSRFAAEDRALLDRAVEAALGKDSTAGGCIVIGTQTLEQSLDLDADYLVTDLCPMDVLLQRIGRLHRHQRARPEGFSTARAVVLCPEGGLEPLTRAPENGLGAADWSASLSGVYIDVPCLAATLEQIETEPLWRIPAMNRALVEAATHPEALDRVAEAYGWQDFRQRVTGKALAEMRAAGLVALNRDADLPERFPDDEKIRTRLGEEGAVLSLPAGTPGPFGLEIRTIALPPHWSRGLTGDETVDIQPGLPITLTVSDRVFFYGATGLIRESRK